MDRLYIFDTTDGIDGAPCTHIVLPGEDPIALTGNQNAVGIEGPEISDATIQSLRLNADGETIDVLLGYSRQDNEFVRTIRRLIDSDLHDAAIRLLVDLAIEFVTIGVDPATHKVALTPETIGIGQRLKQFLSINKIVDDSDLDDARELIVQYKAILDARNE